MIVKSQASVLNETGLRALIKASVQLIDEERSKLESLRSTTWLYWLGQRLLTPSDKKIEQLNALREILTGGQTDNLTAIKVSLREWFEKNYHSVSAGQNHLHLMFEPGHLTRTQKMLDNVKHIFALDSEDGYNTSLFHK